MRATSQLKYFETYLTVSDSEGWVWLQILDSWQVSCFKRPGNKSFQT